MADQPNITDTERTLRRLVATMHTCDGHLYGDDGELQCATCRIDFLRDDANTIDTKLMILGITRAQIQRAALGRESDTARLDWLEQQFAQHQLLKLCKGGNLSPRVLRDSDGFSVRIFAHTDTTLRATIDAAMHTATEALTDAK